jgi:hypothetical protein
MGVAVVDILTTEAWVFARFDLFHWKVELWTTALPPACAIGQNELAVQGMRLSCEADFLCWQ